MRAVFILADSVNRRFLTLTEPRKKRSPPISIVWRSGASSLITTGAVPLPVCRRGGIFSPDASTFWSGPGAGSNPLIRFCPPCCRNKTSTPIWKPIIFIIPKSAARTTGGILPPGISTAALNTTQLTGGPDKTGIPHPERPEGFCGLYSPSYEATKSLYGGNPEKYSTPRTYNAAAQWLQKNHDADNFLLWVEGFDPHEPFDVPKEYMDLYEEDHFENSEQTYWPRYERSDSYTPEEIAHLRRRYKALLSMTDHYIGKLLDVLDQNDMWKDTMVIFTTDHGFMLGEHGFFANATCRITTRCFTSR